MKFLILFFTIQLAWGQTGPEQMKVGPEFTFTNKTMIAEEVTRFITRWEAFKKTWSGSKSLLQATKMFFDLPARYSEYNADLSVERATVAVRSQPSTFQRRFNVSDDVGVVEVTMKEITIADLRADIQALENDLFVSLRKAGFTPSSLIGGGEINLDYRTFFGNDVKKLSNFLADLFNYPALFDGLLEKDYYIGTPMSLKSEKTREYFKKLHNKTMKGKITSIEEYAEEMNHVFCHTKDIEHYLGMFYKTRWIIDDEVLNREPFKALDPFIRERIKKLVTKVDSYPTKKSFLNALDNITYDIAHNHLIRLHDNRLEIKALHAQENAVEFLLLSQLFAYRANAINEITDRGEIIQYQIDNGVRGKVEAYSQFYYYVTGATMDINEYQKIIPSKYRGLKVLTPKKAFAPYTFFNMCNRHLLMEAHKKIGHSVDLQFPDN
ncbi:MAG: hypothetical protein JNM93_01095 [Bacteriovoracaceae bacterium]|nr:hypothetical protein [Bacteriovoracaceae bacterium]